MEKTSSQKVKEVRAKILGTSVENLSPAPVKTLSELLHDARELRRRLNPKMDEFTGPYTIRVEDDGITVHGPGIAFTILYGSIKPSPFNTHLSDKTLAMLAARERCIDLNIAYIKGGKGETH